jgi:hypothetical protein
MSVIPLSAAIKDGLAPDPDRTPEPIEQPGDFNNDAFEKHFQSAWEKAENSKPTDAEVGGHIAAEPKGLDAKLRANFERAEAQEAERAEFNASRESRDELNGRYGKNGDIATTISMFVGWADELKRNPALTAQAMAESYARATPWALHDKVEKPQRDDPYGAHKLNDLISDSIDRATSDKKDFEATKGQRAKLKEMFPHLSFDEAMKTIVRIDRDMHRDPLNTAGQVAAMFGMPITPAAAAADQRVKDLGAAIDRALPSMPGFQIEPVMGVLQDPNFPRTHDPVADVRRAHELVQHQNAYWSDLGDLAMNYIEHLGPELGGEVKRVTQSDEFKRVVANSPNDALGNLRIAHGMAQQRLNARGVSKAKRAAPVRSRSTHTTKSGSSGLDAIIGNAIAGRF